MSVARRKPLLSKARLVCCLVLGTVVLVPATATAKHPTPPTGGLNTAAATGSAGYSFFTGIAINAQSGPTGENPSGTVTFTALGQLVSTGSVTCLSVIGNTAVLNFRDEGFGSGTILTVSLTDNSSNESDVFTVSFAGRAPTDCSPVTLPAPSNMPTYTVPFITGGATVVDAPSLPTSKEQCKNGGWAQYGFANQGQCIKSVSRL